MHYESVWDSIFFLVFLSCILNVVFDGIISMRYLIVIFSFDYIYKVLLIYSYKYFIIIFILWFTFLLFFFIFYLYYLYYFANIYFDYKKLYLWDSNPRKSGPWPLPLTSRARYIANIPESFFIPYNFDIRENIFNQTLYIIICLVVWFGLLVFFRLGVIIL